VAVETSWRRDGGGHRIRTGLDTGRDPAVVILMGIFKSSKEVRIQIVLGDYGGADALGAIDLVPSPGGFIGFAGRAIGHFFFPRGFASAWVRKSVRASAIAASLATTTGCSFTLRPSWRR
jgi:hypothetical protein